MSELWNNLIHLKNPSIHWLFDPDGVVFEIILLVQQSYDPDGVDIHREIKQKSILSRRVNSPIIKWEQGSGYFEVQSSPLSIVLQPASVAITEWVGVRERGQIQLRSQYTFVRVEIKSMFHVLSVRHGGRPKKTEWERERERLLGRIESFVASSLLAHLSPSLKILTS